ncbi:potassium channel protein [bacterium]|nr:potassium channel protein [bacterium]
MKSMYRRIIYSSSFLIFTIILGVTGYKYLVGSHISTVDALYMTIITLTTVGFGEIVDLSLYPSARIFTMVLILIGMANLLFVLSSITSLLVDGQIQRFLRRKKVMSAIKSFDDHFIVCGAGKTGLHIINELHNSEKEFIVIEKDPEVYESLINTYMNIVVILGDATTDEVLTEAGIRKAKALACVLPYDKDNLFLTITAKHLKSDVRIITKIVNLENKKKMLRAGASSVVPPHFIGALRLVSELIRPTTVGFLDTMLRDKENLRIEEIEIPAKSWTIGKTLGELRFPDKVGTQVIAMRQKSQEAYNYYPKLTDLVEPGTVLITIGDPERISRFNSFVK